MGGHVVRADPALVHQRLDQRVIVGDLVELTVPQQVSPGVADVAERHPAAGPQHRGERGAHALERGVGDHHAVQRVIRVVDRVSQRVEQVGAGRVFVEPGQGRDRRGAGDFAGGMTAHAVSHGQQARPSVRRVLVPLPEEADV
jgi:hypothetical protein